MYLYIYIYVYIYIYIYIYVFIYNSKSSIESISKRRPVASTVLNIVDCSIDARMRGSSRIHCYIIATCLVTVPGDSLNPMAHMRSFI